MIVSSEQELNILRECGRRLAVVNQKLGQAVRPGVTTLELDRVAEAAILSLEGDPVFKGYRVKKSDRPFPGSLCASVNDEVVHGIPRRDRLLKDGDIVSLDFGMRYPRQRGLITDMATTFPVGKVSNEVMRLVAVTRETLITAIDGLRAGIRTGDLGSLIQQYVEKNGFGVIREMMGHGVGRGLHEDPNIPNFGWPGEGPVIKENSVLAIEPMATLGNPDIAPTDDGWTWRTSDGSPAAHFEHTVFVTREGAEILTRLQ